MVKRLHIVVAGVRGEGVCSVVYSECGKCAERRSGVWRVNFEWWRPGIYICASGVLRSDRQCYFHRLSQRTEQNTTAL